MSKIENPQFSPEEKIWIGEFAKEFARFGEDAIHDLAQSKIRLSLFAFRVIDSLPANDETVIIVENLMHDVRLIDEVLRQARAIRQFMGEDDFVNLTFEALEE